MNTKQLKKTFLSVLFLLSNTTLHLTSSYAQQINQQIKTTYDDQTDLSVTAYNNNLALVRDRRQIALPAGQQDVYFADVTQQIKPETVSLRSVSHPGSISILEQNYEYDLISPEKILEKYVGKNVELVNFSQDIGFSHKEAKLLSVNGSPVYLIDGKLYLGHPGNVVVPEMPNNLVASPSLIWLVYNQNDTPNTIQEIEASYLTGGINWKADYVAVLARNEKEINLEGWVTLTNNSGATFNNAQLKLVAGDIHTVAKKFTERVYMRATMAADGNVGGGMTEESFADFHLYKLPRKTTIKNNQSKQVKLLGAHNIQVKKIYEYYGSQGYYSQRMGDTQKSLKVSSFLTFDNKQENHMGIPMPAGTIRVYQEDSESMLQFAGEDSITHTPKDEEIKIKLGHVFDLVIDRVQTNYRKVSDRVHQSTHEITLKNHKDTDVIINVYEPMSGQWEILEKSHNHVKKDASTAHFIIPVKANSSVTLKYRVQISY